LCGRFSLTSPLATIAAEFGLASAPAFEPHYNIAPTQPVAVVRARPGGERELTHLRWGLVPAGADPNQVGARLINARSESVMTRPAFRAAFRARRCLMPADGFYEWRRELGRGEPFYVRRIDRRPFAFAALWERSGRPGARAVESCTLLTTEPNAKLRLIHDRMPVVLDRQAYAAWLDPASDPRLLASLLVPYADDVLEVFAVSGLVNDPRNDDRRCIEPVPFTPRLL